MWAQRFPQVRRWWRGNQVLRIVGWILFALSWFRWLFAARQPLHNGPAILTTTDSVVWYSSKIVRGKRLYDWVRLLCNRVRNSRILWRYLSWLLGYSRKNGFLTLWRERDQTGVLDDGPLRDWFAEFIKCHQQLLLPQKNRHQHQRWFLVYRTADVICRVFWSRQPSCETNCQRQSRQTSLHVFNLP